MTTRIAIIGGGIAGVTAAWQIAQLAHSGADIEATLFEASPRFGGIVETVHREGFTVECGPDGWVTEKPWARDLAIELGLESDLLSSNDDTRKTHILIEDRLQTMPDGLRMMVPTDLDAVDRSPLFSSSAKQAFHDELARASELQRIAPEADESIASFTRRHFGTEVLTRIAAPLLAGVLGGDVETLSVQAVMPQFVAMERSHGSLIAGLQARASRISPPPIFTTLRGGLESLIRTMIEAIPQPWLRRNTAVQAISHNDRHWRVYLGPDLQPLDFDQLFLATPPHVTRSLLRPLDPDTSGLLELESTSAIIVALAFPSPQSLELPPGFGFLVPPSSDRQLLACTFVDQKFAGRVPSGARLFRAFFGGSPAASLLNTSDETLAELAREELARILGPLPQPAFTVVRRWPRSLPQYAVGHLDRMAALDRRIARFPGLSLLGNSYRGVGLPDLIRDARSAARHALSA